MIGAATAVSLLKGFCMLVPHRPHVGNHASNRGRCGARRARQMSARTGSLTADKIAVRCRDRTLARPDRLTVGGKAHRTAGLTPFEAGVDKQLVEPLRDRLALDEI